MKLKLFALPALLGGYTYHSFQEKEKIQRAKQSSIEIMQFIKEKYGIPGLILGVSIDGRNEFLHSVGYADIENLTEMKANSCFRIASISKSITSICTALLLQEGKINLDAPIQDYVPTFPIKFQDGKEAPITLRKLLSHTSGLRHYFKTKEEEKNTPEFKNKEFHSNVNYPSALDALQHFQNDELYCKQGSYYYSSHTFTLIQAAIEKASGQSFKRQIQQLCQMIGLNDTQFDDNQEIVSNRCRYYQRVRGKIYNCPEVNLSNKWAGGGLISTASDLLRFGNFLLYCYQKADGPLKQDVLKQLLSGGMIQELTDPERKYALGFHKTEQLTRDWIVPKVYQLSFGHSGGAVGCTSNLIIIPRENQESSPSGIVVLLAGNLTSAKGVKQGSRQIADLFWDALHS